MAGKAAVAVGNNSPAMRKRVYWRTPSGIEHGIITREERSGFEVYSYSTGERVNITQKDVAKVIDEKL